MSHSVPDAALAEGNSSLWQNEDSRKEDAFDNWLTSVHLKQGDEFRINPGIHAVRMGLGWDKGVQEVDVDASAVLLDAQGNRWDGVHYEKLKTRCGSVVHHGDNYTGEGEGDDEVISVDFTTLPSEVHHIFFFVAIFSEGVSFKQVEKAYVRMSFGKEPTKDDELCRLSLTETSGNGVIMGQITRKGAYWYFKALGIPVCGRDHRAILRDEKIQECLSSFPSASPILRSIVVDVLKGKGLVAKDSGMLGLKTPSSDPYPTIKFKENQDQSCKPQKATLEPDWNHQGFSTGPIMETEDSPLEISVFDHNVVLQDTFMGTVQVPGSQLFHLGPGVHMYWFPLCKSKEEKYKKQKVSGEILVRLKIEEL